MDWIVLYPYLMTKDQILVLSLIIYDHVSIKIRSVPFFRRSASAQEKYNKQHWTFRCTSSI